MTGNPDDLLTPPGTNAHASLITLGRHPAIQDALQWLTYSHLPVGLQQTSSLFYSLAVELLTQNQTDGPELTHTLNNLLTAKDHAVRAAIRHQTGRAGSIPRPQTVVNPPHLEHHDGNTIRRVHDALMNIGLTSDAATEAINEMQNAGILLRERYGNYGPGQPKPRIED